MKYLLRKEMKEKEERAKQDLIVTARKAAAKELQWLEGRHILLALPKPVLMHIHSHCTDILITLNDI